MQPASLRYAALRMSKRPLPVALACAVLGLSAAAEAAESSGEEPPRTAAIPLARSAASFMRRATAARRTGPITLDGKVDEPAWRAVPWNDDFTQLEPDEAAPASVRTRFKVLWDDEAIYLGVECDDPLPPTARLSRRDTFVEGDFISFDLDTTHDRRTGFHFQVYAAGQQLDGIHFNDTEFTTDWDAAWESSVATSAKGWSVEVKIPLRVLRIPDHAQVFGFNIYRYLSRRHEQDQWRYRPRGTPGDMSQLGLLGGLDGIKPVHALELQPFVAARTTITTPAPSTRRAPAAFASGCASVGTSPSTVSAGCIGLDLRYNLASDLSLVATINPDFGQVEADARVLNLSTFETFFPEKRPFFLEGLDLFKPPFRVGFGGPYGGLSYQLFYSRRIGQPPAGLDTSDNATVLYLPAAAPVLSAVKMTGTIGGTSVGFLSSIEPKVFAQVVRPDGVAENRLAADASYSGALRLRTPLGDNAIVGFTGTASDPMFTGSARRAHVGAADFTAFDSAREYSLNAQVAGSLLEGNLRDVERDGTVLGRGSSGSGTTVTLNKRGGSVIASAVFDYLSPEFTTNELGYMPRANLARLMAFVGYNDLHPNGLTQRWNANFAIREIHDSRFNVLLFRAAGPEIDAVFSNYWSGGTGFGLVGRHADDRELADGTPLERQPGTFGYANLSSDSRKPVSLNLNLFQSREFGRQAISSEVDWSIGFRPIPSFEGSLEGAYIYETGTIRQIRPATALPGSGEDPTAVLDPQSAVGRTREYLLAPIFDRSLSTTLRGTLAFSPLLTLQAYAQLFTAGVAYGNAQRAVVGPGRSEVTFAQLTDATAADAAPNNDSRQVGLNLNLILRWEWRLGSTLYLVYAHQTANQVTPSMRGLSFGGDLGALSQNQGAVAGDTLLLKIDFLKAL